MWDSIWGLRELLKSLKKNRWTLSSGGARGRRSARVAMATRTRQGGDASSSEDEDENDEPYVDRAADEVVPRSGENEEDEDDARLIQLRAAVAAADRAT